MNLLIDHLLCELTEESINLTSLFMILIISEIQKYVKDFYNYSSVP